MIAVVNSEIVKQEQDCAGMILNIMRFSTQDGPGLRTTVFLKGCPLSCSWCHNPESQFFGRQLFFRKDRCISCGECLKCSKDGEIGPGVYDNLPDELLDSILESCTTEARDVYGKLVLASNVMAEVKKDLPFFEESGGGVTFSGGEPFSQPEFLEGLLIEAKKMDLHVAVDTCGLAPWPLIEKLRSRIDLFLYDLKIMDESRHIAETGVSNTTILANLKKLSAVNENIIIRIPLVPGINDDEENIRDLISFIKSLKSRHQVKILPYHQAGMSKYELLKKEYQLGHVQKPDTAGLEGIASSFRQHGIKVSIGGNINHE